MAKPVPRRHMQRPKTMQPTSRVTPEVDRVSSRLRSSVGTEEGRAEPINSFNGNDASKEPSL